MPYLNTLSSLNKHLINYIKNQIGTHVHNKSFKVSLMTRERESFGSFCRYTKKIQNWKCLHLSQRITKRKHFSGAGKIDYWLHLWDPDLHLSPVFCKRSCGNQPLFKSRNICHIKLLGTQKFGFQAPKRL